MPITIGPSTIVPDTNCPACGHPLNRATGATGAILPTPGDISICLVCAAISIFKDDMTTRAPTAEEMAKIEADPDFAEARHIAETIRDRGLLR